VTVFEYLAAEPVALIVSVSLLGLIVGSFLNVVIYRLPILLEREWSAQCTEYLCIPDSVKPLIIKASPPKPEVFNLAYPASHCPKCGHQITALENIPVLSYIWQQGRCTECHTPIPIRYPLIEIFSAATVGIVAWQVGFGWALLGYVLLSWALIALSMIDLEHYLLPDNIVLPFLWLGVIFNIFGVYTDLHSSIIGLISGYLSLWLVFQGYKLLTGKEGMGFGDFKLLALFGAWLGWQFLPIIILISSLVGAIVGILFIVWHGSERNMPIPFGPFLSLAGWMSMLWGNELMYIVYGSP